MAHEPDSVADLMPRRPVALFTIGLLGGFVAVLGIALLVLIAARAPDEIRFTAAAGSSGSRSGAPVVPGTSAGGSGGGGGVTVDGFEVATANGCIACHSIDGATAVGPTWLAVLDSERTLESGEVVVVDRDYLERSIVDPRAQIAQGFPEAVMPANYGSTLSPEQIDAVIDYIASLG